MAYHWIDMSVALGQLGGSDKLYKAVVTGFYERYRTVDELIKEQLAAGDYDEARRTAHSIKGLSGNLGSAALREKALNLEMAIRDRTDDIEPAMAAFSEMLSKVVEELITLCKRHYDLVLGEEKAASEPEDSAGVQTLLQNLYNALGTHKYTEVKSAADAVKAANPGMYMEGLASVMDAIDTFDYDAAKELLRKMTANG